MSVPALMLTMAEPEAKSEAVASGVVMAAGMAAVFVWLWP
jgi:hypothetical protein